MRCIFNSKSKASLFSVLLSYFYFQVNSSSQKFTFIAPEFKNIKDCIGSFLGWTEQIIDQKVSKPVERYVESFDNIAKTSSLQTKIDAYYTKRPTVATIISKRHLVD